MWEAFPNVGECFVSRKRGGNKKVSVQNGGEHWNTLSPYFSNCIGNDVASVRLCLTTFHKKTNVY